MSGYIDYQKYKDLYDAANSAPWYTGAIVTGIVMLVAIVVCLALKIIIRRNSKS